MLEHEEWLFKASQDLKIARHLAKGDVNLSIFSAIKQEKKD